MNLDSRCATPVASSSETDMTRRTWRAFTLWYVFLLILTIGAVCLGMVRGGEIREKRDAEQCLIQHNICNKEQGKWVPWMGEI